MITRAPIVNTPPKVGIPTGDLIEIREEFARHWRLDPTARV